jgi:hypothetical protein
LIPLPEFHGYALPDGRPTPELLFRGPEIATFVGLTKLSSFSLIEAICDAADGVAENASEAPGPASIGEGGRG